MDGAVDTVDPGSLLDYEIVHLNKENREDGVGKNKQNDIKRNSSSLSPNHLHHHHHHHLNDDSQWLLEQLLRECSNSIVKRKLEHCNHDDNDNDNDNDDCNSFKPMRRTRNFNISYPESHEENKRVGENPDARIQSLRAEDTSPSLTVSEKDLNGRIVSQGGFHSTHSSDSSFSSSKYFKPKVIPKIKYAVIDDSETVHKPVTQVKKTEPMFKKSKEFFQKFISYVTISNEHTPKPSKLLASRSLSPNEIILSPPPSPVNSDDIDSNTNSYYISRNDYDRSSNNRNDNSSIIAIPPDSVIANEMDSINESSNSSNTIILKNEDNENNNRKINKKNRYYNDTNNQAIESLYSNKIDLENRENDDSVPELENENQTILYEENPSRWYSNISTAIKLKISFLRALISSTRSSVLLVAKDIGNRLPFTTFLSNINPSPFGLDTNDPIHKNKDEIDRKLLFYKNLNFDDIKDFPGKKITLKQYEQMSIDDQPEYIVSLKTIQEECKKICIVGVHGWYLEVLNSFIPQAGNSMKFIENMQTCLLKFLVDICGLEPSDCEKRIYCIPLSYHSTVDDRVGTFLNEIANNVQHTTALKEADLILWNCHSQGVPVSIALIDKLIESTIINTSKTKLSLYCMAGITHGPVPSPFTAVMNASAKELFTFGDPSSNNSQNVSNALRNILDKGIVVSTLGSTNDRLVPLHSSLMAFFNHKDIHRYIFISNSKGVPFAEQLIRIVLIVRNKGYNDFGLLSLLYHYFKDKTNNGHSHLYMDINAYIIPIILSLGKKNLKKKINETYVHEHDDHIDIHSKKNKDKDTSSSSSSWFGFLSSKSSTIDKKHKNKYKNDDYDYDINENENNSLVDSAEILNNKGNENNQSIPIVFKSEVPHYFYKPNLCQSTKLRKNYPFQLDWYIPDDRDVHLGIALNSLYDSYNNYLKNDPDIKREWDKLVKLRELNKYDMDSNNPAFKLFKGKL